MSAADITWWLWIGAILGALAAVSFYEPALRKADRDYRRRTSAAVANVRRFWRTRVTKAERAAYERGWRDANAVWRNTYETRADRHLTSVPVLTDDELREWFGQEGPA